jgi:uncharacterized glyoxalase superfamily protein PhnB
VKSNRSIPDAQCIPVLSYPDVSAAAEWLCRAFGFSVRLRIGDHRVQLAYGSGAVIVRSGSVASGQGGAHAVMVRVTKIDEHFDVAVAAGARTAGPPTTYPYGERQYSASDFAGHQWTFSETVEDADPASWGGDQSVTS